MYDPTLTNKPKKTRVDIAELNSVGLDAARRENDGLGQVGRDKDLSKVSASPVVYCTL